MRRLAGFLALLFIAGAARGDVTVDLTALQAAPGFLPVLSMRTDDPVYGDSRRYEGYPLKVVLNKIPCLADMDPEHTVLVFKAADGYHAAVPLSVALNRRALLAFRDMDAPTGNWHALPKYPDQTPAPFYVVWETPPGTDPKAFPWSYQTVSLELMTEKAYYGAAYPRETSVLPGFKLFAKHCLKCHSINLSGGTRGPELNVPKNITEYWTTQHLRMFIRNPLSYRARSNMPAHNFLDDDDLADLLAYLEQMRFEKICQSQAGCAH